MRLLALDAATEACSAALWLDGDVQERFEVIGRGHADRLLPMAQDLFATAGLSLATLDAIAFGRGPGGFTGLRIAAGIAQGLAAGADLPVLPVSDLAALAFAARRQSGERHVLACLDARMGQVYWAAFDCSASYPLARSPEALDDPGDIVLPDGGRWFAAGPALSAYPRLLERLQPRTCGHDAALLPRAGDVAGLAAEDLAAGRGVDAALALPVYLRNQVVQQRP